ncbi:MAG: ribosome small subunit-dependent GTPase A [Thermogutta sp.]|uniref:ribosome small subunit-dependent GTPase A n=1 Tax=Thermogutta sp. TaxID=1962930 RepID=UPI0019981D48|nr:ribosome small subunit-dependent GTPase A [Thermogutta sp.]MBC7354167.1 ribosome small subunit-dependent GTPase A [Thermogutta sp.]
MGKDRRKKYRVEFRKNRAPRTRDKDLTDRVLNEEDILDDDLVREERVGGRNELTRRGTVIGEELSEEGESPLPVVLPARHPDSRLGRVIAVQGLICLVEDEEGNSYRCVVRRLLKRLATDQRHVVVTGDKVYFYPLPENPGEGVIESVLPRHGSISRESKGKQHVIVSNVDQVLIVSSAAMPRIKPHLIDRMIVAAEKSGVEPVICINKVDLVDRADLMPLVGLYSQLGYRVLLVSALSGFGLTALIRTLKDRVSVLAGQSGVGKSSLLNALDPDLKIPTAPVSEDTEKGRHTTTTARLYRFRFGGYVADTPGIRHFQPWDLEPEEVANYFRDLRPYVNRCKFPNCLHIQETECGVKDAVADGWIDERRYESYCHLVLDEEVETEEE